MSPNLLISAILSDTRLILVFTFVFLLLFSWNRRQKNLPPGPISWPFLGSFPAFAWQAYRSASGLHELLTSFSKTYGKIYGLNIFGNHLIVISDYQLLKEALNNLKINDRHANNELDKVFGTTTLNRKQFEQYRKFAMTTFRQFGVGRRMFEDKVGTESVVLQREIAQLGGKATELHGFLNNATANVISSVVFGQRYEYRDVRFERLMNLANRINDAFGAGGAESQFPLLSYLPTKAKRDMKVLSRSIKDFVNTIIEDHRANFHPENINDFVDAYLKELKSNKPPNDTQSYLTDDNMRCNILTLFVAGADTTSNVIYWAILYLTVNSGIQSRLQSELDTVIGRNRLPKVSDKASLPYTRAVIQEIFRMASPVPLGIMHAVSADTTIGSYCVPRGATVVPNIWAIHHDPRIWKDPDYFRPERFLKVESKLCETHEFVIPFSVGRRSCPGEALAQTMVYIFLTHLFHQFRFERPDGSPQLSLQGELGVVYKPVPFKVCAKQRE